MRPGDRKQRWKSVCEIDIIIFGFGGGICAVYGLWIFAGIAFIMVYFSMVDHKRGWKLDYRLPPNAIRDIKKGDKRSVAIAYKVLRLAGDPDRQKYAFEKGKK